MKSHRHILSKKAQSLHMESIKGQGHLAAEKAEAAKPTAPFAPTLLKSFGDKARRRVLRAASRLRFWDRKSQ